MRCIDQRTAWAVGVLLAVVGLVVARAPTSVAAQRHRDWSWIENTVWYVTEEDLPAVETDLATRQTHPLSDQTVWHIQNYSHGYFWGTTAVQLTGRPLQCLNMVGSVTPEGDVQITFVTLPLPGLPPALALRTSGIGSMQRVRGEWRFRMQMTTGVTTLVTHWAYMRQCEPGDECERQLPGVQSSLQDFIGPCGD